MATARPEVLDFLLTRRSHPVRLMQAPAPDRDALLRILTAAARAPDHGKLEPWRFIVLSDTARSRFAAAIRTRAAETGQNADKGASPFEEAPLSVAVVAAPRDGANIPLIEQTLSAGAVCLGLVNAALADGWGASWLTGWPAYDRDLLARELGLADGEWIAGFVHVGSRGAAPPERPRPDMGSLVTWAES